MGVAFAPNFNNVFGFLPTFPRKPVHGARAENPVVFTFPFVAPLKIPTFPRQGDTRIATCTAELLYFNRSNPSPLGGIAVENIGAGSHAISFPPGSRIAWKYRHRITRDVYSGFGAWSAVPGVEFTEWSSESEFSTAGVYVVPGTETIIENNKTIFSAFSNVGLLAFVAVALIIAKAKKWL